VRELPAAGRKDRATAGVMENRAGPNPLALTGLFIGGMQPVRRLIAVVLAAALAASAFAAVTAIAAAPTKPATIKLRSNKLGKILVNANSQTLYLFEKDKNGKSACSGQCAKFWPPVLTKGKPMAGSGIKASLLGTTKRSDGTTQVTYNKHPLYRFLNDKNKVGSTKGEGVDAFGAEWYVVGANGKKIEKEGS
jgi:predicted lipoprotein with Yx(FWY)xxD motif